MKQKLNKNVKLRRGLWRSDCCSAPVKTEMSPDFFGDTPETQKIGTCSFICYKCNKPCDLK